MFPTDLTVSAIVEKDGQFLLVDEYVGGRLVLNQPGGHIESGESPENALVREVLEETGCTVACGDVVGVYLWIHPQSRQQFLRIVFAAEFLCCDENRQLDDSVVGRIWLTATEIEKRRQRLRTPVVLRCIRDYVSGRRLSDTVLTGILPLQNNVDAVLARADLV